MLLQVWTAVQSLSRGLFFWSNAEEALATNDQGSDIDARLPELWFADIPHCTVGNSRFTGIWWRLSIENLIY
jgi:hypothetical protein